MNTQETDFDVAIIGGNPLACAIARDAVGRGLRVVLMCENDLGGNLALEIFKKGRALTIHDQDVPSSEQSNLLRIFPQQGRLTDQVMCPLTAMRFAMLCVRDAADRGAKILTQHHSIEYAMMDSGWRISTQSSPKQILCRLLVETRPVESQFQSGKRARIAVFAGEVKGHPQAEDSDDKTDFAYNMPDNLAAIGLTSGQDITTADLRALAAKSGLTGDPTYVSEPFSVPSFNGDMELAKSPPRFFVADAGNFDWRWQAEAIVAEMAPYVQMIGKPWTGIATLPGGDFQPSLTQNLFDDLQSRYSDLEIRVLKRLFMHYGTQASRVLGNSELLGIDFGHGLFESEVRWLIDHEWARSAADVLWRRTYLGLLFKPAQTAQLAQWVEDYLLKKEGQVSVR